MASRTSRLCAVIAALALGAAPAVFAADPATSPAPTAEQRQKMADVHQHMAECLRSERPIGECRSDMAKSCEGMMGEAGCPMMGKGQGDMRQGMMHRGGMGGGTTKGAPAPETPKK